MLLPKPANPPRQLASTNKEVIEQFHGQKTNDTKEASYAWFISGAAHSETHWSAQDWCRGAELAVLRGAKTTHRQTSDRSHSIRIQRNERLSARLSQRFYWPATQLSLLSFGTKWFASSPAIPSAHSWALWLSNILAISNRNLHKWLMIFHTADSWSLSFFVTQINWKETAMLAGISGNHRHNHYHRHYSTQNKT